MDEKLRTKLDAILRDARRDTNGESVPGAYYSPEGDCAFFFNEGVPHRRSRVDSLLTVYRADDDDRIVGVQIKGIKKLPIHDDLEVRVQSGGQVETVELLMLTYARQQAMEPEQSGEHFDAYKDAFKAVSRSRFAVEGLRFQEAG